MSAYCCVKLDLFINIESWCTEPWVSNGGPITSCSTMMVHWRILIYQCNNILLLKTHCDHPPLTHSPNLDPHEFSFLRMKSQLWGHCWQNVPEILNSCWQRNVIQKVTSSTSRSAGHVVSTQKGTSSLKGTTTNKKSKHTFHYQRPPGTFGYALTHCDQA